MVPGPYPYLVEEGHGPIKMFAIPTENKMVSSDEAKKLVKAGITLMGPLVPGSYPHVLENGQMGIRNDSDLVNKMNHGYKNHRSYSLRAEPGYPEQMDKRSKTYRSNSMRVTPGNAKKIRSYSEDQSIQLPEKRRW